MLNSVSNTPLVTEFSCIYLTNTLNQTFSTATVKRKSFRKKQQMHLFADFYIEKLEFFPFFLQMIHISLY